MDGNFVVIFVIQISLLVLLSNSVRGEEKYFDIITDPALVKRLAVSAAQMELQTQPGSESPVQDVIIEIETATPTIFNRNTQEIIRLCADAIPVDIYGFQFELTQYRGPSKKKRSFQVEPIESPTDDLLQLETLNCPRLSYFNLETGGTHTFFDIYFLSQGTDQNSVIVLKKGHVDRIMYPQHCITNISFDRLTALSRTAINVATQFVPNRTVEVLESQSISKHIITYQTLKRSADVYAKFTRLFQSLAVCSILRTHKIYACRQAIETHSSHTKVDSSERFEEQCKKRSVHLDESGETAELYLSRCPPTTLNVSVVKELRQTTVFYIASNASPRSVVLFSHPNMKGEKIQPLKVVSNLDVRAMKQDKERARLSSTIPVEPTSQLFKSSTFAYENLKKLLEINWNEFPVQMPATLARQKDQMDKLRGQKPQSSRFIHTVSAIEKVLIEFSRIKKNVFVYQKFRETYTSIDFCNLTSLQKKSLCDEALSDAEYGLVPNPNFTTSLVRPCYRQKIALTSFEAERLQTETFSMWACPPSLNHPTLVYYMGKSHLRDAAFLYRDLFFSRKSDKINAIHPVTLFLHINRYKLANVKKYNE